MKILSFLIVLFLSSNIAYGSDLDALLKDRVLGDEKAPVTITEYSSLSCPHCKHFHTDVLPQLKESYIDSGKAKLVMADYPLNAPALNGSMVARCFTDDDTYFRYMDFLFETQNDWATMTDPRPYLAQNARMLGISSEELDSCMQTEGYMDAFIARVQNIRETKDIQSTPTFIIEPSGQVIRGNKPYAVFETALNAALKQTEDESAAGEQ